jgi:hypothetical protein
MLEVGGITRVVLRLVVLVGLLVAAEHLVKKAELGPGHSQHREEGYQVAHFARDLTVFVVVLQDDFGCDVDIGPRRLTVLIWRLSIKHPGQLKADD